MALQLGRATGIAMRTAPYALYRGGICLAMGVCGVAILGVLGVIGHVFGEGAFWVSLGLVLLLSAVLGLLNFGLFHLSIKPKAGHIALLTEVVNEGLAPPGIAQLDWCKRQQPLRFKEAGTFRLFRSLVKQAMLDIHRGPLEVRAAVPFPGMEGSERAQGWAVHLALRYLDELILGYAFRGQEDDVFESAQKGILLYCSRWRRLFEDAFRLTLLAYGVGFFTACAFMLPLGVVASSLPPAWMTTRFILYAVALFLGLSAKWIVFDPIAHTSLLITFFEETAKVTPDDAWEESLVEESEAFCRIKELAEEGFEPDLS